MEKILITGANGFIGRNLLRELLTTLDIQGLTSKEIQIYLAVSPGRNVQIYDERVSQIEEPIFSKDDNLYQKLGSPSTCIHLAWKDGFSHNSPAHMENLSDHERFCRTLMKSGLKRLTVLGTMHEVGYWEGAIDENTPCKPLTQYGIAKNALRESLLITSSETKCILRWLRAFYITGDEENGRNIFSKILLSSQRGMKRFPFTTGTNKYDFIDVKLLCRMILACTYDNSLNKVINICSGNPVALSKKVENFINEKKLPIKLDYAVYPDRKYDSPAVWGDSKLINDIMNKTTLEFK